MIQWRFLMVGAPVWAKKRSGWTEATIVKLGKNRGERTSALVVFEDGRQAMRKPDDMASRDPELQGRDKPRAGTPEQMAFAFPTKAEPEKSGKKRRK